jgi:hypothetical protein
MLKGSLQGSQLITEDPKYLTRINVDNALFSEDSDSISFYYSRKKKYYLVE